MEVVVPPNATAQVTLPDGDGPVTVGSGVWQWRMPYTTAERQGYTLDDPIVSPQVSREAVTLWQGGEVAHMRGAGHCIHRDRYAETMAAIDAFLSTLPSRQGAA